MLHIDPYTEITCPWCFLTVAITDACCIAASNIADADVLADVAVAHGFGRKEARAIALDASRCQRIAQETASSRMAGVRSVPRFVFGNRFVIHGGPAKTTWPARSRPQCATSAERDKRNRALPSDPAG